MTAGSLRRLGIEAIDVELTPNDLREIESASKITVHGARYSESSQRMIDR